MSHFTTLNKVAITDQQAFIKAAAELGFTEVLLNAKMNGYMGNTMKAEVVVRMKGCAYDIGLVRGADGKLEVISDWWGVNQTVRDAANRISQLTTKHTVIRKYAKLGFMAQVKTDAKNNVVVTLTR